MLSGIGNTTQMMSRLFTQLDTKNQGYLEKSDLASAFSQISGSSDSSGVDDVFAALDSDSDGKVSESEFSSTLTKLQEALDSQFNQMRLQGGGGHGGQQGMGGMPPPPPPGDGAGFSKEELSSQLEEIGSGDSERSSLIANIVSNFEAADSDGDGKVSFTEAMAYDQSSQADSTSSTASDTAGNSTASAADAQVMMKIMQLMHAYGGGFGQEQQQGGLSSLLSATA